MCDQTQVSYLPGDIVWTKLANIWWPGEVISEDDCEDDISRMKKPPLCIVKFFNEDAYEYPKDLENIYHYICLRKDEFIKKGLELLRAYEDNNSTRRVPSCITKFPKDVIIAEEKTGGDPYYLEDPKFVFEKEKLEDMEISNDDESKPQGRVSRRSSGGLSSGLSTPSPKVVKFNTSVEYNPSKNSALNGKTPTSILKKGKWVENKEDSDQTMGSERNNTPKKGRKSGCLTPHSLEAPIKTNTGKKHRKLNDSHTYECIVCSQFIAKDSDTLSDHIKQHMYGFLPIPDISKFRIPPSLLEEFNNNLKKRSTRTTRLSMFSKKKDLGDNGVVESTMEQVAASPIPKKQSKKTVSKSENTDVPSVPPPVKKRRKGKAEHEEPESEAFEILKEWDEYETSGDDLGEESFSKEDALENKSEKQIKVMKEEKASDKSCFDFEDNEEKIDLGESLKFGQKLPRVCDKTGVKKNSESEVDDFSKNIDNFLQSSKDTTLEIPKLEKEILSSGKKKNFDSELENSVLKKTPNFGDKADIPPLKKKKKIDLNFSESSLNSSPDSVPPFLKPEENNDKSEISSKCKDSFLGSHGLNISKDETSNSENNIPARRSETRSTETKAEASSKNIIGVEKDSSSIQSSCSVGGSRAVNTKKQPAKHSRRSVDHSSDNECPAKRTRSSDASVEIEPEISKMSKSTKKIKSDKADNFSKPMLSNEVSVDMETGNSSKPVSADLTKLARSTDKTLEQYDDSKPISNPAALKKIKSPSRCSSKPRQSIDESIKVETETTKPVLSANKAADERSERCTRRSRGSVESPAKKDNSSSKQGSMLSVESVKEDPKTNKSAPSTNDPMKKQAEISTKHSLSSSDSVGRNTRSPSKQSPKTTKGSEESDRARSKSTKSLPSLEIKDSSSEKKSKSPSRHSKKPAKSSEKSVKVESKTSTTKSSHKETGSLSKHSQGSLDSQERKHSSSSKRSSKPTKNVEGETHIAKSVGEQAENLSEHSRTCVDLSDRKTRSPSSQSPKPTKSFEESIKVEISSPSKRSQGSVDSTEKKSTTSSRHSSKPTKSSDESVEVKDIKKSIKSIEKQGENSVKHPQSSLDSADLKSMSPSRLPKTTMSFEEAINVEMRTVNPVKRSQSSNSLKKKSSRLDSKLAKSSKELIGVKIDTKKPTSSPKKSVEKQADNSLKSSQSKSLEKSIEMETGASTRSKQSSEKDDKPKEDQTKPKLVHKNKSNSNESPFDEENKKSNLEKEKILAQSNSKISSEIENELDNKKVLKVNDIAQPIQSEIENKISENGQGLSEVEILNTNIATSAKDYNSCSLASLNTHLLAGSPENQSQSQQAARPIACATKAALKSYSPRSDSTEPVESLVPKIKNNQSLTNSTQSPTLDERQKLDSAINDVQDDHLGILDPAQADKEINSFLSSSSEIQVREVNKNEITGADFPAVNDQSIGTRERGSIDTFLPENNNIKIDSHLLTDSSAKSTMLLPPADFKVVSECCQPKVAKDNSIAACNPDIQDTKMDKGNDKETDIKGRFKSSKIDKSVSSTETDRTAIMNEDLISKESEMPLENMNPEIVCNTVFETSDQKVTAVGQIHSEQPTGETVKTCDAAFGSLAISTSTESQIENSTEICLRNKLANTDTVTVKMESLDNNVSIQSKDEELLEIMSDEISGLLDAAKEKGLLTPSSEHSNLNSVDKTSINVLSTKELKDSGLKSEKEDLISEGTETPSEAEGVVQSGVSGVQGLLDIYSMPVDIPDEPSQEPNWEMMVRKEPFEKLSSCKVIDLHLRVEGDSFPDAFAGKQPRRLPMLENHLKTDVTFNGLPKIPFPIQGQLRLKSNDLEKNESSANLCFVQPQESTQEISRNQPSEPLEQPKDNIPLVQLVQQGSKQALVNGNKIYKIVFRKGGGTSIKCSDSVPLSKLLGSNINTLSTTLGKSFFTLPEKAFVSIQNQQTKDGQTSTPTNKRPIRLVNNIPAIISQQKTVQVPHRSPNILQKSPKKRVNTSIQKGSVDGSLENQQALKITLPSGSNSQRTISSLQGSQQLTIPNNQNHHVTRALPVQKTDILAEAMANSDMDLVTDIPHSSQTILHTVLASPASVSEVQGQHGSKQLYVISNASMLPSSSVQRVTTPIAFIPSTSQLQQPRPPDSSQDKDNVISEFLKGDFTKPARSRKSDNR